MTSNQLQTTVIVEATILLLICLIIIFSFKRWKIPLYLASASATAAFFYVWTPMMAFGSLLVYGPASMLLWLELNKKDVKHVSGLTKKAQFLAWCFVATGVGIIILTNVRSIMLYLR